MASALQGVRLTGRGVSLEPNWLRRFEGIPMVAGMIFWLVLILGLTLRFFVPDLIETKRAELLRLEYDFVRTEAAST
jgi:hypothetical protein